MAKTNMNPNALKYQGRPASLDVRGQQLELFPFDAFTYDRDLRTVGVNSPWRFVFSDAQGNEITDIELLSSVQENNEVLEGEISALTVRVGALETLTSTHTGQISDLTTLVGTLQSDLGTLTTTVTNLLSQGSTVNGIYLKYATGTMISYSSTSVVVAILSGEGELSITFPEEFDAVPQVFATFDDATIVGQTVTTTGATILVTTSSLTDINSLGWYAIGPWA